MDGSVNLERKDQLYATNEEHIGSTWGWREAEGILSKSLTENPVYKGVGLEQTPEDIKRMMKEKLQFTTMGLDNDSISNYANAEFELYNNFLKNDINRIYDNYRSKEHKDKQWIVNYNPFDIYFKNIAFWKYKLAAVIYYQLVATNRRNALITEHLTEQDYHEFIIADIAIGRTCNYKYKRYSCRNLCERKAIH